MNYPFEILNALNEFERYGIDSIEFPEPPTGYRLDDESGELSELYDDALRYRDAIHKQFERLKTDLDYYFRQFTESVTTIGQRTNPDYNGNTLTAILDTIRGRAAISRDGKYITEFAKLGNDYILDPHYNGETFEPVHYGLLLHAIGLLLLELDVTAYGTRSEFAETKLS